MPVAGRAPVAAGGAPGASAAPPAPPIPAAPSADAPLWARIVRSPTLTPMLRAILTNSTLVEVKDGAAVLDTPARFAAGARSRLGEIAAVFERELGRRIEVSLREPGPASGDTGESAGGEAAGAPAAPVSPVDDPLVKIAMELFNARIVSVQPRNIGT